MKKVVSAILLVAMLLLAVGCDDPTTPNCEHEWQSATCESAQSCLKCFETRGEALGHTTETGKCSRCGLVFSSWEISEYVDEFQQPTGEKFVTTDAYGTFSNSATTNSELYACVQVTTEDIAIMLWEYGSYLVKGVYDTDTYSITVLDENGIKHYFNGVMYEDGTRIYISSAQYTKFRSLLKKPQELSIYLKYSKYTTSTYLFTIETDGFFDLYSEIQ